MDKQYIQHHHIIQRYLHGKLTATESAEFEEYVLTHPDIAEEFELSALFKKALSPANAVAKNKAPCAKWLHFFWPLFGLLAGSAATYVLLGHPAAQVSHQAVSPDIVYIGEMRGVSTTQAPPVGAVIEPSSEQQLLVLDVSSSHASHFNVTLQDSNGETVQQWSNQRQNRQGEIVVRASLQTHPAPSTIITVTESNSTTPLLRATVITGSR